MNGPSPEVQKLMERLRANRDRLQSYFGDRAKIRRETLSVLYLQ